MAPYKCFIVSINNQAGSWWINISGPGSGMASDVNVLCLLYMGVPRFFQNVSMDKEICYE